MHSRNKPAQFALAAVAVYRCTVHDVTVFSDRPCEPDAATYEADTSRVSTYSPPATSPSKTPVAPPARRKSARASASADQVRHQAVCQRLRDGLKEVAARMRAGYNAKQGEQLRERKARLEAQRRAQKCR